MFDTERESARAFCTQGVDAKVVNTKPNRCLLRRTEPFELADREMETGTPRRKMEADECLHGITHLFGKNSQVAPHEIMLRFSRRLVLAR